MVVLLTVRRPLCRTVVPEMPLDKEVLPEVLARLSVGRFNRRAVTVRRPCCRTVVPETCVDKGEPPEALGRLSIEPFNRRVITVRQPLCRTVVPKAPLRQRGCHTPVQNLPACPRSICHICSCSICKHARAAFTNMPVRHSPICPCSSLQHARAAFSKLPVHN